MVSENSLSLVSSLFILFSSCQGHAEHLKSLFSNMNGRKIQEARSHRSPSAEKDALWAKDCRFVDRIKDDLWILCLCPKRNTSHNSCHHGVVSTTPPIVDLWGFELSGSLDELEHVAKCSNSSHESIWSSEGPNNGARDNPGHTGHTSKQRHIMNQRSLQHFWHPLKCNLWALAYAFTTLP